MALITESQRLEEFKARLEMMANNETLTEDEKMELIEQTAIRDRLMRRLTKKKVSTKLGEGEDEVVIDTRLMKGSERERFLKFNAELADSKGEASKYNAAMLGLKEFVGDLCLTPALDKEYWVGGEVSDDVVLTVALNTFNGAAQAVKDSVEKFRL